MYQKHENIKSFFCCKKQPDYLVFPYFSEILTLLILILAVINFQEWTLKDKPLISVTTAQKWGLTLSNGYGLFFTNLFTYHLVVYSLAHLAYTILLIHYYLVRGECFLGHNLVAFVYVGNALVAPILTFLFIKFFSVFIGASWAIYTVNIWNTNYYVGPSIAIWGVAGFILPKEKKNFLYWLGFVMIIGLAILLKLLGIRQSDWTADIAHLIAFFGSAIIGYLTYSKWGEKTEGISLGYFSVYTLIAIVFSLVLVYFLVLL